MALLLDTIIPPENGSGSPELRRWRLSVAFTALSAWVGVFVFVVPLIFTGIPGMGQLAWSDDVEKKIERAVEPIKQDVAKVQRDLDALAEAARKKAMQDLRQQIFETRIAQCAASKQGSGSNPYTRRLADLQDRYTELNNGMAYSLPDCEDL